MTIGDARYVDHIGIVVRDLEPAVARYRQILGDFPVKREESVERGLRVAFIEVGQTRLEVLMPLREGIAIADFLRDHGEGIQHIAFRVDSVADKLALCGKLGLDLIDRAPRIGLSGVVGFISPKGLHGVTVEFVEDFPPGHGPK